MKTPKVSYEDHGREQSIIIGAFSAKAKDNEDIHIFGPQGEIVPPSIMPMPATLLGLTELLILLDNTYKSGYTQAIVDG